MTEKQGTLRMLSNFKWALCRPGEKPIEIASGEIFHVWHNGEMKPTRMENSKRDGYYCSVDGYLLYDGVRVSIGAQ
jgi:hypothetical protein